MQAGMLVTSGKPQQQSSPTSRMRGSPGACCTGGVCQLKHAAGRFGLLMAMFDRRPKECCGSQI